MTVGLDGLRSIVHCLKESLLLPVLGVGDAQVVVGGFGSHPSLGCAVEEAELQQIGFDHVHDGIGFFADAGGDGV